MEAIVVKWSEIKQFTNTYSISMQYFDRDKYYDIYSYNGTLLLKCILFKNFEDTTDLTDFETNYKPIGNKSMPLQFQPFSSKTLANGKSLYKRFAGISQVLTAGSNTFTWQQSSYPWAKFLGIEVIGAELGDTCDLYVLDTPSGTYSGVPNYPLNQFAFSANVAPSYYRHISEYDADIRQNLQIKFVYNSVSAKTLYINFDMNEVK